MNNEMLKTGTTTVGILGKDLVVLAADKRATAGHFIADKFVEKVVPINKEMAVTTAGTVSDIQLMVKYLKAELKLKELRSGRKSTAKEAANLLGSMNYNNVRKYSTIAGLAHFLFAGTDKLGVHLYELYMDGSIMEIKEEAGFVTSGSGSVYALGLLEDQYTKDLSEKECVELALRAIQSALKRDTASGEGIDVFVIDKNGVKQVAAKKIVQTLN